MQHDPTPGTLPAGDSEALARLAAAGRIRALSVRRDQGLSLTELDTAQSATVSGALQAAFQRQPQLPTLPPRPPMPQPFPFGQIFVPLPLPRLL